MLNRACHRATEAEYLLWVQLPSRAFSRQAEHTERLWTLVGEIREVRDIDSTGGPYQYHGTLHLYGCPIQAGMKKRTQLIAFIKYGINRLCLHSHTHPIYPTF